MWVFDRTEKENKKETNENSHFGAKSRLIVLMTCRFFVACIGLKKATYRKQRIYTHCYRSKKSHSG